MSAGSWQQVQFSKAVRPRTSSADLQAAKAAARERYTRIAELLKAEAGVVRHYKFKKNAGLAWTGQAKILAPAGVTRRQLYVLAHECGHIVLHSHPAGQAKPSHVKEHEAETYALRAFARYDLEVPEKSARWARGYVGQWIMKDRAEGIPICAIAEQFATGRRAPHDPLPAVDGKPVKDFSKQITSLVAEGNRVARMCDQQTAPAQALLIPSDILPNACATCWFFKERSAGAVWTTGTCSAFAYNASEVRFHATYCNSGAAWRPHPDLIKKYSYEQHATPKQGFWSRLRDALIDRISGRYRERGRTIEGEAAPIRVIKNEVRSDG